MFLGHAVKDPHEGDDESVYVVRVVSTRSLKNHQCAKQLGGGATVRPDTFEYLNGPIRSWHFFLIM